MIYERTYSSIIYFPDIAEYLSKSELNLAASKALDVARLEEPIKTGNLRRSTNYTLTDEYVEIYINPSYYLSGKEYYQFLDDNNTRVAGYWERTVSKFKEMFFSTIYDMYNLLKKADEKKGYLGLALLGASYFAAKKKNEKNKKEAQ